MTTFASAFTELVRYSTGLPEPEVVHSHNLPNGDLEDVREKLSHWTGQPVTEDQVKKLFFLHDNTHAKIAFDHRLKMDPFHPAYDHGPLMGIGHPDEIALPDQSGNDERVLAVQTHDKRDAANTDNAHHFGHVYVYKDYNEKPTIYLNYLIRGPHSRNPNGSKQMMDLLDTAKELGFSGVHCQAYTRKPKFVGSRPWPKLGFNDYIPTAMVNKLPDHLKHLQDMNELMASDEGQQLWDDHIASLKDGDDMSATLDHAHFDLTPGSRSNLLLERYRQEYNRRKGIKTTYRSDHDGRRVHPDDEEQPVRPVGRRDRRGVGQQAEEGAGGEADPVRYAEGLAEVLKYTLASHEDFHRAIHNEPQEQTHHLAYADWLQEQGHEAEADHIRKAVENGNYGLDSGLGVVPLAGGESVFGGTFAGSNRDGEPATLRTLYVGSTTPTADHRLLSYVAPVAEHEPVSYSDRSAPVRYSAVPAHDVHDDYKPTGIAPRVGNALSQLAQEDTDAGLMAEGILRTGDHSLLKYLADKLDDDDHPLKDAYDWRHLDRGIQIDKALHREIGRHDVTYPDWNGLPHTEPLSAGWLVSNWRDGMTIPLSRTAALRSVRKSVPDANKTDIYHSILRLLDNHFVRGLSEPGPNYSPDYTSGTHPPERRRTGHGLYLTEFGAERADPHTYPDTRPVNKRYAAKYGAFKTPAGGMVVKESPYAVTGNWRAGGAFTNVPQPDVKTKKFTSITQIIAALKRAKSKAGGAN